MNVKWLHPLCLGISWILYVHVLHVMLIGYWKQPNIFLFDIQCFFKSGQEWGSLTKIIGVWVHQKIHLWFCLQCKSKSFSLGTHSSFIHILPVSLIFVYRLDCSFYYFLLLFLYYVVFVFACLFVVLLLFFCCCFYLLFWGGFVVFCVCVCVFVCGFFFAY